ncbi:MAG: hypothetical protein ACJ8OJ_14480 [Povalibacter sp.]|jgi:hypothetical protein
MPVPWLQIVQWVPSILDVSRELLRKQRSMPPLPAPVNGNDVDEVARRIVQLEDNERRQAELVNQMAEQIAQLARAVTVLYRRTLWLTGCLSLAIILAVIGIVR